MPPVVRLSVPPTPFADDFHRFNFHAVRYMQECLVDNVDNSGTGYTGADRDKELDHLDHGIYGIHPWTARATCGATMRDVHDHDRAQPRFDVQYSIYR